MPTAASLLRRNNWDDPDQPKPLFEEFPVSLDTFVQSRKYLGNPPLSPVQYAACRHAERVYLPETYGWLADNAPDKTLRDYWSQQVRMVNFLELQWGKGGGKDHTCRIIALRVCYLLLCLTSPQDYYAMPEQDSIHVLNVASSSKQAQRAFFTPLRRAVLRPGNWFQNRGVDVMDGSGRSGGGRTTALLDTIRFEKNIEAVSGHSDADSQEGLNLILGIADEIDAFRSRAELAKLAGNKSRESSSSAEAILDMLRTSASTRFPATYKNVHISYPRYLGSTIQQLTKKGKDDIAEKGEAKSRYYVSGPLPSWEANPRIPGKDAFSEDYEKDPILARAKYECKPSRAVNPYFSNEQALEECFYTVEQYPVQVDYVRDGATWRPTYQFSPDFYPVRGALYAMHADLAVTGDRAGVSLAHVKRWTDHTLVGEGEEGLEVQVTERRPVVKVDFTISYESTTAAVPPREIQIRWARLLCLELRRMGFPIMLFTFDQYQSKDSMQILESHGIETDRFSTDVSEEGWRTLRDVAYEGRLEMPFRRLVLNELLGLSRLPNGKIDHLGDGSKDEADSLAGAVCGALTVGGMEDETGKRAYPGQHQFTGMNELRSSLPMGFIDPRAMDPLEPADGTRGEDAHTFHGMFGDQYLDDYGYAPVHQQ
jgi:hypothetical protein